MNKQELIDYLKDNGFSNEIVNAFNKVKREDFVLEVFKEQAYENQPLSLEGGATISQPYTIAFMLKLMELDKLDKKSKILEIGSGSGYVLALIDEIAKNNEIIGIERLEKLVIKSSRLLKNKKNIQIIYGDGSRRFGKEKFDRILISACCLKVPEYIYPQLNDKGIIVASVQNSIYQIKKIDKKITKKEYVGFSFVPLREGVN